jgi:threonine/homoserine/homoserine lactone efflux protein
MAIVINFLVAFFFSFIGSIPPGTINLTALQLGLEHKTNVALRLAFAAAIIEYFYAWLSVIFEQYITSSPVILENFKLIAASVMILFGAMNLMAAKKPTGFAQKFQASGFRRGLVLGILNPMAMPFWIAITAYLKMQGWVVISSSAQLHAYLLGVSVGGFLLLVLLTYLAKKMVIFFQSGSTVKFIPGIVLLVLGIYGLIEFLVKL